MQNLFPIITCIDDVLPYIKNKSEIQVREKDEYTVIDYVIQKEDTFDSAYALECRGLIFDLNGDLIRRPLHKFKNTHEDLQWNEARRSGAFNSWEKMDGSMIAPFILDGTLRFGTRGGITDVSLLAEKECKTKEIEYACRDLIEQGYTPVFEYTSPNNRIVLSYDKPSLTLLAVRDMTFGNYKNILDVAKEYSLNLPKDYIQTLDVKDWQDKEGIVVWWDNGHAEKMKADEYVLKHKAKDSILRDKDLVKMICEGVLDDVIPLLDDKDRQYCLDKQWAVLAGINFYAEWCKAIVDRAKTYETRKEQALCIQTYSNLPHVCFSILNGKDAYETMLEYVIKHCSSSTTLKDVEHLFGLQEELVDKAVNELWK